MTDTRDIPTVPEKPRYEESFNSATAALEYIRQRVETPKPAAISFDGYTEPYIPHIYTTDTSKLIYIMLQKPEQDRLLEEIVDDQTGLAINQYKNTSQKPTSAGFNGTVTDSKIFPTRIKGLVLQIIFKEEWWQMMGGGHVASSHTIWLINHQPLSLKAER